MRKIDITELKRKNEKKQGEYWQERFEQLEAALHRKDMQQVHDVRRLYENALREINRRVNEWYGRFAENNVVTVEQAHRLLESGELQELRWTIREYIQKGRENGLDGRWIKELENASARVHIQRLEALRMEVQAELEQATHQAAESTTSHISDTYQESYSKTAYELQKGTGIGIKLGGIDPRTVNQIISKPWAVDERNFSERLWVDKVKLINETRNILSQMVMTGNDAKKATAELSRRMGVAESQAGRVILTESAAFRNNAQAQAMKDMGLKKYKILETLDRKTCDLCGEYDNELIDRSDFKIGVTAPPFHPNCRGTIAPHDDLFDDILKNVGKRAARGEDGKTYFVPSGTTYEEWKEKYMR